MLWFKTFFKKHGAFFVGAYLLSFFLLITLHSRFPYEPFTGDLLIELGNFTMIIPFVSALATAVFAVTIFSVYRFLK